MISAAGTSVSLVDAETKGVGAGSGLAEPSRSDARRAS